VIFAAILGMIFLSETPVPLSILGYVLIIGTAVFRWNRMRKMPDTKETDSNENDSNDVNEQKLKPEEEIKQHAEDH